MKNVLFFGRQLAGWELKLTNYLESALLDNFHWHWVPKITRAEFAAIEGTYNLTAKSIFGIYQTRRISDVRTF